MNFNKKNNIVIILFSIIVIILCLIYYLLNYYENYKNLNNTIINENQKIDVTKYIENNQEIVTEPSGKTPPTSALESAAFET